MSRADFAKRGAQAWEDICDMERSIDQSMGNLPGKQPSTSPLSTSQLETARAHMRAAARLLADVERREVSHAASA